MRRHPFLLSLVSVAGLLLGATLSPRKTSDQHEGSPGSSEWCKENPGKCQEAREKHAAFCKENPERCAEMKAKRAEREAYCKENPATCAEQREKYKQHRAEMKAKCEADPAKCEEMKQARREKLRAPAAVAQPDGAGGGLPRPETPTQRARACARQRPREPRQPTTAVASISTSSCGTASAETTRYVLAGYWPALKWRARAAATAGR